MHPHAFDAREPRALGGISAFLLVATIVGFVLARRTTSKSGRATVANLNARIYAWWLMIALVGAEFLLGLRRCRAIGPASAGAARRTA